MINGALLVDKPVGPTSQDIVRKVRWLLRMKKVGHTGTLDPFATGLLVVLLGDGTKLARFLNEDSKEYEGYCTWGQTTDTADLTGSIIETSSAPMPKKEAISEAMLEFIGQTMQVPPMYSAKKVDGRPLYKSARKGEVIERKPVPVHIRELQLLSSEDTGFSFRTECSKGTYIRTLAEDLCVILGGLGHLKSLRRTGNGGFFVRDALTLEQAEELANEDGLTQKVIPVEQLCNRFCPIQVVPEALKRLTHGYAPEMSEIIYEKPFEKGETIRLVDAEDKLLALALALVSSVEVQGGAKVQKVFKIENNFLARQHTRKTQ